MKLNVWGLCAIMILAVSPAAHPSIEEGVNAVKQKDYAKALAVFSAEAKKGNPSGFYYLGRLSEQGLGVTQNMTEAARQYRRAFEALSKATKAGKSQAMPTATESASSMATTPTVPAIDSAPATPPTPPTPTASSDQYARPEGMSNAEWRDHCLGKACAANRKVIMCAVELYNLDHPDMIRDLADADIQPGGKLMTAGSLKTPIQKPVPGCAYSSEGDLSSVATARIKCAIHGSGD